MRLVLRQSFPLGRFHATQWRASPFDQELAGEWPPSPWRLTRAVVARWYQWRRETAGTWPEGEVESLIRALCASDYRFYLPPKARQSVILRQYQPVEFGWNPATKKAAGIKSYGTSLTQDNGWCTPPDENLFWFVEGDSWTPELTEVLDRCLERIVYFGRAEALTRICRTHDAPILPNVTLCESRTSGSLAPVLVPCLDATRTDIECDARPAGRGCSTPGGHRVHLSGRFPAVRQHAHRRTLSQFALGWAVAPERRATVRLTARFRTVVLSHLLRIKTKDAFRRWNDAPAEVRNAIAGMTGRDLIGEPLRGPRAHAEFLLWWDGDVPTRLLVWRDARPFDEDEQEAMLRAAAQELSWAAAGPDAEAWKVKLVPLDSAVAPPPGFDGVSAKIWQTLTAYVPPRHHLRRGKVASRRRSKTRSAMSLPRAAIFRARTCYMWKKSGSLRGSLCMCRGGMRATGLLSAIAAATCFGFLSKWQFPVR